MYPEFVHFGVYLNVVEDQVTSHVLDVVLSSENGPTERAGLITEASIIQLHIFNFTAQKPLTRCSEGCRRRLPPRVSRPPPSLAE